MMLELIQQALQPYLQYLIKQKKVSALAAAGMVYLHTRSNRFSSYNDGHGVEFTFRWAEVPTGGTCGVIIPGGTCDDISVGPFDGDVVVFYDTDWDSQ